MSRRFDDTERIRPRVRTAPEVASDEAPLVHPALAPSNAELGVDLARRIAAGEDVSLWFYADDDPCGPPRPDPLSPIETTGNRVAAFLDRLASAAAPDGLPPEDAAFVADARANRAVGSAPSTLAERLQPSAALAVGPLWGWRAAVARAAGDDRAGRALARIAQEPPSSHADPAGRELTGRVRTLALGTAAVLASPGTGSRDAVLLELEGRAHRISAPNAFLAGTDDRLPAALLFDRLERGAGGDGRASAAIPCEAVDRRLRDLLALVDPVVAPVGSDGDPAHVDSEAVRLAAVGAHGRTRFAGLAIAIAEAARVWGAAPLAGIRAALDRLDRSTAAIALELAKIRRALRLGEGSPRRWWDGLARQAAAIASAWASARSELAALVAGLPPGDPVQGADVAPPEPAVAAALEEVAANRGDVAALAAARAVAGDPLWAQIVGVCLGAELLARGRNREAHALGLEQFALARGRRDAIAMAEAIVLSCDAHGADPAAALAIRREGARSLCDPSAAAALSLVSRWRPSDA